MKIKITEADGRVFEFEGTLEEYLQLHPPQYYVGVDLEVGWQEKMKVALKKQHEGTGEPCHLRPYWTGTPIHWWDQFHTSTVPRSGRFT